MDYMVEYQRWLENVEEPDLKDELKNMENDHIGLIERLKELYDIYGYCLNTLHSYEFPGSSGMEKMNRIMGDFHKGVVSIAGMPVVKTEDYSQGLNGLPKSDVLKFYTDTGSVVIRPSGTEPKLKTYISITAKDKPSAENIEAQVDAALAAKMG